MNRATALIFGVSGQDGVLLTQALLERGFAVHGTSRDPNTARRGNLGRLGLADRMTLHEVVPSDFGEVSRALQRVGPSHIVNLAAQSSVGLSFQHPFETVRDISLGTLNILEAMRRSGSAARFLDAGSGDCFGSTDGATADETFPFRPASPYAVGKASAHWSVVDYRTAFGLSACSALLFNHESPLRSEHFVTRKIIRGAADIASGRARRLRLGALTVVRDWGWAPDYVEAMIRMLEHDAPEDIVLATGAPSSLRDFVAHVFTCFGMDWRDHVDSDPALMRPTDIPFSAGNPAKAARLLNWRPSLHMPGVVERLVEAERRRERDRAD